jgi:hypothetical protein
VRARLAVVALVLLVSSPASAQFKIATDSASVAADAVVDRLDDGSGPGTLVIFGSACPDDADDADSGTTLAVLTFSDPAFGSAVAGVATANAITADSSANATGTALCFRAKDSDANVVFQGAITTSGGGGQIVLSSTSITSGQSVSITSLTYTQPTQTADIFAPSCSASDVQTALNSAGAGDVISIPAGTCNWTTQVAWTAPANVTVLGAGSLSTLGGGDTTIIQDNYASGSPLLTITANTSMRIAGLTVRGGSGSLKSNGVVFISGNSTLRLDHVHLDSTTYSPLLNVFFLWIGNGTTGVLHDSIVDLHSLSAIYFADGAGASGQGNEAWAAPTNFGCSSSPCTYFYMEDNLFRSTTAAPGRIADRASGSRVAWRFNTIQGLSGPEIHGTGHSMDDRGARSQEGYGNRFTALSGQSQPPRDLADMGSGTSLIWGNVAEADSLKTGFLFNLTRRNDETYEQDPTPTSWGYCGTEFDGTNSNWDGNTPSAVLGYPCIDQIGRGQGDLLTGSFPTKVNSTTGTIAWPNQALEPAYTWMNDVTLHTGYGPVMYANGTGGRAVTDRDYYEQASGIQTTSSSPFNGTTGAGWGTAARRPSTCTTGVAYFATDEGSWNASTSNPRGVDFAGADGRLYKCTSTNTWTLYYTPYTYPHPLRGGS